MFSLGNTFGKKSKPKPDEMIQSDATINGTQEALRRAINACELKTAELTEAQNHLARLEREAGQKDADNEDPVAATQAVQDATIIAKRLEHSLSVLLQRRQEAEVAVTNAQRVAEEELKAAACARVLALGPRAEALFIAVEQLVADLVRDTEALPVVCGHSFAYGVGEVRMQFEFFLGISKRPPSTKGADSGAYRKYKNFSECLEAICGNGARNGH